jgi:hypothetical protein
LVDCSVQDIRDTLRLDTSPSNAESRILGRDLHSDDLAKILPVDSNSTYVLF